jgi:sulfotransferase
MKSIIALSGLPRTGSTLLTSILSQNPEIYAGPNSPLCQLSWDLSVSAEKNAAEQIAASSLTTKDVVRLFAQGFYANINQPIIIDKCRSWTLPANMNILEMITDKPRVIVMVRPLDEIVKSFVAAYRNAGYSNDIEEELMCEGSEPIMRSLVGVRHAKLTKDERFIFIEYDDLVDQPEKTISKIYQFCEWTPFTHDFNNIFNPRPEPDDLYDIPKFHEVRPVLSRRHLDVQLSEKTLAKCRELTSICY